MPSRSIPLACTLLIACASGTVGTGDDTAELLPNDTDTEIDGSTGPEIPFSCDSSAIEQGTNSWTIDGLPREFHADLPSDLDTPAAVLFTWHGVGDTVSNWRRFIAPDPDGYEVPLIVIAPEDADLLPWSDPPGLDWDIFVSERGDDNIEAALFEEILGCLDSQFAVDTSRIYSMGFSGGAVATNMIHARYDELVSSIVTLSGLWLSDPAELYLMEDLLTTFNLELDIGWDDVATDKGNVMMTHGGDDDTYVYLISFELAAQAAVPYLTKRGRTVVDCAHDRGHTNHPELAESDYMDFLMAHVNGQPSPYADGLPDAIADICTVQ